jgi:copper transport protein
VIARGSTTRTIAPGRHAARVRRGFLALVAALALVFVMPVLAYAHATLVSADPAVDGKVATSPMHVRLQFSEELEPSLGRISIVGPDGKVISLKVSGDPHDVNALIAPLHTALAPGGYRVNWRIVSADGHPVDGSYVCTVGDDGPPVTTASPMGNMHDMGDHEPMSTNWGPSVAGAPIIASVMRGLGVGTLMAAAGLLLFISWTPTTDASMTRRAERLARWLTIAFAVLLALHMHAWAMNAAPEHRLDSEILDATMNSGVGRLEMWRTGIALLAALALLLARRPRIAMVLAFLALLVSGATGHSAVLHPLWTTPAKALHLVAGAVWLGGLLWLLTVDRSDPARFEREALRVSSLALIAVIVVTFSGVVQTVFFLPKLTDVYSSAYGAVSLAKLAGLLVLVGFGAHHKFRVLPRLMQDPGAAGRFSATLRREVVVMTIVILLGGLLGYVPPPDAAPSHMSSSHTMEP